MTTPFVGEIQIFGFNFNPKDWALCNGTLIPIQQNTALFSLLGTNYGGNGTSNFQLPNFAHRAPCEQGSGPGLTPRVLGENFGQISVSLTNDEVPSHSHSLVSFSQSDATKKSGSPSTNAELSLLTVGVPKPYNSGPANTQFAPNMLGLNNGGNVPHENQQPYLAVNFCIALAGAFPSFG
jgi:microcystin-dependent protein